MHTTINWTQPINWLIALVLVTILLGQLGLIIRNPALSYGRKWLRASLNGLLWLALVGYFCQFTWPVARPATHALLVADGVPNAFVRRVKDSLRIEDSFTSQTIKPDYDSITLVGQRFPAPVLTQLSNARLQWIPYWQPDQLQSIRWKGILRQGEIQRITGRIQSSKKQMLRLQYGGQTLDSAALQEGANTFAFRFPAFTRGRTQTELRLGNVLLDSLHFFARPTEPLTVQFILGSPDFESKTLADWLGKHGHTVYLSATLSKQISSNVSINKAGRAAVKTTPDLLITEPVNASNALVRKALTDGKAVLFINLTNPETDCRVINQALGSRWQVRRTSNEAALTVKNGLNALPFAFADQLNQFAVAGYPIAVQQTIGRGLSGHIGVSLLSETFPLSLSGDSTTYNRIWSATLARLVHAGPSAVLVNAPVYSGIRQVIYVNNAASRVRTMPVGLDTVPVVYSPLNEHVAEGTSLFKQPGWQTVQDSLAMYVDGLNVPLHEGKVAEQFIQAHAQGQTLATSVARTTTTEVPNWVWLLIFVTCFTALWLEPKF